MRQSSEAHDMDYSFNAKTFRTLLHAAIAEHFSEITARTADDSKTDETPEQLMAGMEQAIDVMERADADAAVKQGEAVLSDAEITEIGDFALGLLRALVDRVEAASGRQDRQGQGDQITSQCGRIAGLHAAETG